MRLSCLPLLVVASCATTSAVHRDAPSVALEPLIGPFADADSIPADPAGERVTVGKLAAPAPQFEQALLVSYGDLEDGDHMVCKLALLKDTKWWTTPPIDCGFSDNRDHTTFMLQELAVHDGRLVLRWSQSMKYNNRDNDGLSGVDESAYRIDCAADSVGAPRCSKAIP